MYDVVRKTIKAACALLAVCGCSSALSAPGSVLWEYIGQGTPVSSPAIAPNGNIVISTVEGWVESIRPTGQRAWITQDLGRFDRSPVIAPDGSVYVVSEGDRVYALNGSNGQTQWSFIPDGTNDGLIRLGNDGTLYYRNILGGRMYALNPNGSTKWSAEVNNASNSTHLIANNGGLLLASTSSASSKGGDVLKVSAAGAVSRTATPSTLTSMRVLAMSNAGHLIAVSQSSIYAVTQSGQIAWRYQMSEFPSNPLVGGAVGPDGTIYISLPSSKVIALTPSGREKWIANLTGQVSNPVVGDDGVVYVSVKGTQRNEVFALSAQGTILWNLRDVGNGYGSPVLGNNGVLYIAGTTFFNYGILAIETSSKAPARSAWPMANGNAQHTGQLANACYSSDTLANSMCRASTFQDGNLLVPSVDVDGQLFAATLRQIPAGNSIDLELIDAVPANTAEPISAKVVGNVVLMPFVTVGNITYNAEMTIISDNPLRFRVTHAVELSN